CLTDTFAAALFDVFTSKGIVAKAGNIERLEMRFRFVTLALVLTADNMSAQTPARRASNIAALLAYPAYFHNRQVVLIGQVTTDDKGVIRASDGIASVHLVFKGSAPDGNDEIRGEFWDLGRMKVDEPRLSNIDLRQTFGI